MRYTLPKGVFDILPYDFEDEYAWRISDRWQTLENILLRCAFEYGYKEIRTPIFEKTELFVRSVGESSDIVSKEMYTFLDKGNRSMTLRPEGTVPLMRAFVEHQLYRSPRLFKYFYIGPMFRYERPQSGRYRQHHQFGAEAIGIAAPEQDVEIIDMLCEILKRLGLSNLIVFINSVGDNKTREEYRRALANYLQPHWEQLSPESKARFDRNIIRILDSKNEGDQRILEGAPSLSEFLSIEARTHFEAVQKLLEREGINFMVNPRLVRGLDYYHKTVFEVSCGETAAQSAIGGGGRFDGLISSIGGPSLPSVGFALGLERLLKKMEEQPFDFPRHENLVLWVIPLGSNAIKWGFSFVRRLRHRGLPVSLDLSGKKIEHGLQVATTEGAYFVAIIGDNELENGEVEVKKMKERSTERLRLEHLESFFIETYYKTVL